MTYKISICYPNKEEIEERRENVSSEEALSFFTNYPWIKQLEFLNNMPPEEIHYGPSVRYTNTINKRSLELTADSRDNKLMFSLWYERPVMTKIFFGLFGEKGIMKVVDKWFFDKETSLKHLHTFLNEKYVEME